MKIRFKTDYSGYQTRKAHSVKKCIDGNWHAICKYANMTCYLVGIESEGFNKVFWRIDFLVR